MTPSNGTFLFGTVVDIVNSNVYDTAATGRKNVLMETTTSSLEDSCPMDAAELRAGVFGDSSHWYPVSDSAVVIAEKRPVGTALRSRGRPPRRHLLTTTMTKTASAAAVRKPLHALTNSGASGDKRVLIFTATGATSKCMNVPMGPAMAAVTASATQSIPSYGCPTGGNRRRGGPSPAVYSYSIVNQRLSHIAAFVPPKGNGLAGGTVGGHQSTQIAYRFVFTNAL